MESGMKRAIVLAATHMAALVAGFALGVYTLPILTAPPAPSAVAVRTVAGEAPYRGDFRRDLKDSDALHWGEGRVFVGAKAISLDGEIAPGPDYKLYLLPEFVETERDFARVKDRAVRIGDVKTFRNFIVLVPESVDVSRYNTVLVWCERFSQFITAAKYR
jgi:hypothetical protein